MCGNRAKGLLSWHQMWSDIVAFGVVAGPINASVVLRCMLTVQDKQGKWHCMTDFNALPRDGGEMTAVVDALRGPIALQRAPDGA
jgi:hypothetical protein